MIIDLHIHSYYSADGRHPIPKLLEFYSADDIAGLTDHETIGGWEEFKAEAQKKGVRAVLGVEWFLRGYCHILCYFVDDIPQEFLDFMYERREKEKCCMLLLYKKVKKLFPSLSSYDEIIKSKKHPEGILGMAALATFLSEIINKDFKETVTYLRNIRGEIPECDKPLPFYPQDIINKIHTWNAISVLAHPYKNSLKKDGRKSKNTVENLVKELAGFGIKGVELFSDGSTIDELEHLLSLAHELDLVVSIGSDYHYNGKGLDPSELEKLDDGVKSEVKKWIMK